VCLCFFADRQLQKNARLRRKNELGTFGNMISVTKLYRHRLAFFRLGQRRLVTMDYQAVRAGNTVLQTTLQL